jgi:ABC-type Fe3+/spermidine/putrescine transport system ATPase subunit
MEGLIMKPTKAILSINHLSKRYDDTAVLEDISFDVGQGEVVVLLGPSGCGKSTCCDASMAWRRSRTERFV